MDEENVVLDERIEKLRHIAKSLIIHYIRETYGDKDGINEHLTRINEDLDSVKIIAENRISGSPTLASNDQKGKITLRFKDKDNISDDEINDFLGTLIHEFYHTVSKSRGKDNAVFLEEGFVTYVTAKTVRRSIENMTEIDGVDIEQLKELLKNQDLVNGYDYASEFVRSTQLVMDLYGYDATFEYMFSDNGTNTLAEIAGRISPEFEKMMRRQVSKTPSNSSNLVTEKLFLKSFFEQIEIDKFDKNSIEMNELLQEYLVKSGIALRDERIKGILAESRPELVAYQELVENIRGKDASRRRITIEESLPHGEFEWEVKDSVYDTVEQMTGKLKDFYDKSDSKIKCRTFGNTSFYALAMCYDMIQKGIDEPTDEKIMEYCGFMISDENMECWMKCLVKTYFDKVQEQSQNGKSIVDIINENLTDNAELMMQVDVEREQTNNDNYWKNLTRIAKLAKIYCKDKGNDFYGKIYDTVVEMSQEHFEDDKVYTIEDLNDFRTKMKSIYDIAQMPEHITQTGKTPDKIFLLAATAHAKEGGEKFPEQMIGLLEILKDGNLDLGVATKDLEDFCVQIANAYEEIKAIGNEEQKQKFQELFLQNFCFTDNLKSTNIKIRKGQFQFERNNVNLQNLQEDILSETEFYTRKVNRPNGENVTNLERILSENPGILLNKLKRDKGFLKMFAREALGVENQEGDDFLYFEDIKDKLLGERNITLQSIYSFDYSSINELVPTILKQEAKDMTAKTISSLKKSFSLGYNIENSLKDITTFSNVGEENFAIEQAAKLSGKIAELYTPELSLSDKGTIAMAMITQKAETPSELGIDFIKTNSETFADAVNGLKMQITQDKWRANQIKIKIKELGKKNSEVLSVLEFLESEEINDYHQMSRKAVLTPEVIQEMAKNPEVQECITAAGEVIERAANVEKAQVEH